MKLVIQRVSRAEVRVGQTVVGKIGKGILALVGAEQGDDGTVAQEAAQKVAGLRIFEDENGKMNRSVAHVGGSLLVVSQFTLYGDCRKGMRPSYDRAARPEQARELYEYFVAESRKRSMIVETGIFQASMQVSLTNDGPVTLLLESPPGGKR